MKRTIFLAIIVCFAFANAQAQHHKKEKTRSSTTIINPEIQNAGEETFLDAPRTRVYNFSDTLINGEKETKYGEGAVWKNEFPNVYRGYRKDLDKLRFSMQDGSTQLGEDFKAFRLNGLNLEQDGFSMVSVFTNKPATNILNVKFKSANKGEVTITVLNIKGDKIATEIVKDFSGDYLGQIELPKSTVGTYFVLISQGENGVSRKVKIE